MRAWRVFQGQCLVCASRPQVRPLTRSFNTSAPLCRARKSDDPRPQRQKSEDPPGRNQRKTSRPLNTRDLARKERRSVVGSTEFALIIQTALIGLKRDLSTAERRSANWTEFESLVHKCSEQQSLDSSPDHSAALGLRRRLQQTYLDSGPSELREALKSELRNFNYDLSFSDTLQEQTKLADFRYPTEWFPVARTIQRQIHLHVGPTNSGKTYHALKRLEAAKTGFYAGPLRLLAHEVYGRLSAKGISCGLITGDEVKVPEDEVPSIFSNTVEMVPLGQEVEVGVIDEIQMIGDPQRGWAWTRAVLGSRAQELHLCGEERVVPLIRELAASMGDKLEIHRYERLNPLKAMTTSLKGDLKRLQKGDCLVAFSRIAIHALKQEIERVTGRRAAIVYGSLPAEIRAQQTDLFNDPDNEYDFLVASDAIGMGLNLACKRIIFSTVVRRLPTGLQRLTVPQIKQIGGRAGRYRTAAQDAAETGKKGAAPHSNIGFVTSLEDVDLPYIQEALQSEAPPIVAAGLLPPDNLVRNFSQHFPPKTPFAYILRRMHDISQTSSHYFLCDIKDQCEISGIIDGIKGLNTPDKLIFMAAPANTRDVGFNFIVRGFARCVAENKSGSLLKIPELPLEILDVPVSGEKDYLRALETLHRALVLYLWLSYRCGGVFTDRALATHTKSLVEANLDRALTEFSANTKLRKASSLRRQIALIKQMEAREQAYVEERQELRAGSEEDQQAWAQLEQGSQSVRDKESPASASSG
ncbi:hypothetical protein AJ80_01412 [Polytolypa hystricis UAMH7299]|uniref:RNA helicase n=1 Tax=Polytolypa hystricis (strain UAMH7299) TaxID=1447883 RepID=A0A2B7Z179_POLH7|nr:hypothetical protein AJ80_01412 [Polytolypa hystricis UAMH7299]